MTQKQIEKEKWFRMNVYCNMAVMMTEVVRSLAIDAQGYADHFHKQFRMDSRRRMRRVRQSLEAASREIRYFLTDDLYDFDPTGEKILSDVDLVDKVVRLFVDRAGTDPKNTERILHYLEKLPSRVGLFKDLTATAETSENNVKTQKDGNS